MDPQGSSQLPPPPAVHIQFCLKCFKWVVLRVSWRCWLDNIILKGFYLCDHVNHHPPMHAKYKSSRLAALGSPILQPITPHQWPYIWTQWNSLVYLNDLPRTDSLVCHWKLMCLSEEGILTTLICGLYGMENKSILKQYFSQLWGLQLCGILKVNLLFKIKLP